MLHQMTDNKRKTTDAGHSDRDVPLDMSHMSLSQRARLGLLIEKDGDETLRTHLLGAIGRSEIGQRRGAREIPDRWTIVHCLDRLEEAYQVLGSLPAATRPKEYGTAWPSVVQEKIPLMIQAELAASGDLELREADKNRVRLPPTTAQITRMEEALRWPFEYLSDKPELAKAIQLRTMWSAMGVDIRKRCQRKGIDHDDFNARWQAALAVITGALIARKVPVT